MNGMIKIKRAAMKKWFLLGLLTMALCLAAGMAMAEDANGSGPRPHPEIGTVALQDNGIPVVTLTVDPEEYQKVIESNSHDYMAKGGSVRITIPEGFECEYGGFDASFAGRDLSLEYIRGRGHSTWSQEKKPFKIRFAEKVDLFGMGKGTTWALMANAYDASLLKNHVVSYLSSAMGFPYTPKFVPVDLVVNGKYMGSYEISPFVQVAENSLDITPVKKDATGGEEITGGYLITMEPYSMEPETNVVTTKGGVRFGIKTPNLSRYGEELKTARQAQHDYVGDYLQQLEDAVYGKDGYNAGGTHYGELMDARSAAAYWWIQEFTHNGDAFRTPSTYLYKEMGKKLYWGPLWDFDIALNPIGSYGEFDIKMIWLDYLRQYSPEYRQILRETWTKLDKVIAEVTRDGGILDQYAGTIKRSWENNKQLWNTTDADLDKIIGDMKEDLDLHRKAITANLDNELPNVLATVTFMDGDTVYAVMQAYQRRGLEDTRFPAAPKKAGYTFVRWADRDGKTYEPYTSLTAPVTVYAEYAPAE
ncbi:MAG: CotH kinase family protein [Clostridia bacterium]|nr:CotH kinase family protein [Clostridia bacterium]